MFIEYTSRVSARVYDFCSFRFALFWFRWQTPRFADTFILFYICNFISFQKCELFINCGLFFSPSIGLGSSVDARQNGMHACWSDAIVPVDHRRRKKCYILSSLSWNGDGFSEPERCTSFRLRDRWANLVEIDIDVAVCWIIIECVSVAIQIDSVWSINKKKRNKKKKNIVHSSTH